MKVLMMIILLTSFAVVAISSFTILPQPLPLSQPAVSSSCSSSSSSSSSSSFLLQKNHLVLHYGGAYQEDDEETNNNHDNDNTKDDNNNGILMMLWQMTVFFSDMVDEDSEGGRFYYHCVPPTGERYHHFMPIRDIAVTWDATKALRFWKKKNKNKLQELQQQLQHDPNNNQYSITTTVSSSSLSLSLFQRLHNAITKTLQVYNVSYSSVSGTKNGVGGDGGIAFLDPKILREVPNIAHSALMILAYTGAIRLSLFQEGDDNINDNDIVDVEKMRMIPPPPLPIDALTRGILSMQQPTSGAFCIEFITTNDADDNNNTNDNNDNVYQGIEFYPGEAMVALMDVYELSGIMTTGILEDDTRQAILPSMNLAFEFYSNYYYKSNPDTNFNIWQIQAFARFFDVLSINDDNSEQTQIVANYVLELCQGIIDSKSWKYELTRGTSFYPNLETVEIACGLDSIADGIRVAYAINDMELVTRLQTNAKNAIDFLQWSQNQVPSTSAIGYGGLGYGGTQVLEQRLDVTGHAISALTKIYQTLYYKNN